MVSNSLLNLHPNPWKTSPTYSIYSIAKETKKKNKTWATSHSKSLVFLTYIYRHSSCWNHFISIYKEINLNERPTTKLAFKIWKVVSKCCDYLYNLLSQTILVFLPLQKKKNTKDGDKGWTCIGFKKAKKSIKIKCLA